MIGNLPVVDFSGFRPQTRPSDDVTFTCLLSEWDAELRRVGFPVDIATSPGISAAQVRSRLALDDLKPNGELDAWFGWQNGQPTRTGVPSLTPTFFMMDLDWAIARRNYGLPIGLEPGSWHPSWIRLSSDRVCLAARAMPESPIPIRVVDDQGWNTWDAAGPTEVWSLCTAVVWFIEALRNGSHVWNVAESHWERHDELVDPLAALHGYV